MSIKKIALTTVLALALVVVAAPAVQADQITDLMATIAQLQATVAQLQGGSTATVGTQVGTGFCTGVTFTRTLPSGTTGSDVKCLQSILNSTGIAQTVTGTVGPHTIAGIKTFQTQKGITATGNVGPLTRAALTTAMGTVTVTPPAGGTTGLCPNGMTLASNCTSGATSNPTVGTAGFISIPELAASPASNANVTATSNVPVFGIDVRSIGSDMTVSSVKLGLAVTKGTTEHPATLVNKLYVYDGSTLLGTYGVDTNSVIKDGSNYYVILSGFSFKVPVNTTKTLTVNADFAPSLETNRTLTVTLYGTDSVRATDTVGAYTTNTISGNRQFTVTYLTVGSSDLTISTDTATTKSTNINVNHTSGTTDVPMLVVDAKSKTGASKITDMKFTVTGSTSTAITKTSAIKLYDGNTLLGSASLTATGLATVSTASFTNLTIPVAQDATKYLTVKADFASGVTNGTAVKVTIAAAADVTYTEPDLTSTYPTGTATGNNMYLFDGNAPVLTFVSATGTFIPAATTSVSAATTATIVFDVKADGGTMTHLTTGTVSGTWNGNAISAAMESVRFIPTNGSDGDDLSDGGVARVTVTFNVPKSTTGAASFVKFAISQISWVVGTSGTINQTWGLSDYVTTDIPIIQ